MTTRTTLAQTSTRTATEETRASPSVTLKLRKPKSDKKVVWKTGVVDNEHMGKKKSKCCCIYNKPRMFGESSSSSEGESDDDCKMCRKQQKQNYNKHKDDCCDNDPPQGTIGDD
ncbi:E3 ubiquitin-protein ligase PPP1R11 [Strongylocentrotus purpuratus]|uniref:E3 ubiquitin-protein ligase PPP1R11 n=1 Tax=Strongylocentrotus purpuratus TaxID=7668 RepID=A0A7M7RCZ3_STRPU|nr:E3 ubiquitin-protein ligase PPP1R11 [Strongylocentrotus purpuratus]